MIDQFLGGSSYALKCYLNKKKKKMTKHGGYVIVKFFENRIFWIM